MKPLKLSAIVVKTLRKISREGMPRRWIGFDEAEISWFLDRHKKKNGRNLNKLRAQYAHACESGGNENGNAVLTYFSFSKTQAKALLREIDA